MRKFPFKTVKAWAATVLTAFIILVAPQTLRAQESLSVYSALDEDHFVDLMNAFEAKYPDINVTKIIDSNGPIIARLLAEKSNPRSDIILGAALSGLLKLDKAGVLEAYKPAGFDAIRTNMKDMRSDGPFWVGMDAWADCICYNTVEGEKLGISEPKGWSDLLEPEYKGKILMPNPNSSGTGFLMVAGWLTLYGEEGGWEYMDKLNENIDQYVHSGGSPCRSAASGEAVVGISYPAAGVKAINQGAPMKLILPPEGLGVEIEAYALIKGGQNSKNARLLADFAASRESIAIANKYYAILAIDGVAQPVENYPEGEADLVLDMDFEWLAENRDRILDEWQKRYGIKSAPEEG